MIGSEDIRGCMPRRLSSRQKEPLEELTGWHAFALQAVQDFILEKEERNKEEGGDGR